MPPKEAILRISNSSCPSWTKYELFSKRILTLNSNKTSQLPSGASLPLGTKPLKFSPPFFLNLCARHLFYSAAGGNPIGRENFRDFAVLLPPRSYSPLKCWGESRTPLTFGCLTNSEVQTQIHIPSPLKPLFLWICVYTLVLIQCMRRLRYFIEYITIF